MDSLILGKNHSALNLVAPSLSVVRKISRPVVLSFLLLFLFLPVLVQASPGVINIGIANADFEAGNVSWLGQGNWAGVESCCGQHDTPYWGYNRPDPDTWDGGLDPASQFTRLYQNTSINYSGTWRMSAWAWTNGMTANLRAYLPGRTIDCGTINVSTQTPFSCEFAATLNESALVAIEGTGNPPQWAVSDDWARTPISLVPHSPALPIWSNLPVNYYTNGYSIRTQMAAWSWNDSVGRSLLTIVSDINQASIRFDVHDYGSTGWYGQAQYQNGIVTIQINTHELDGWNSLFPYGLSARQGVMAHEFGHALGLDDLVTNCQLMNGTLVSSLWYCAAFTPTSGEVNGIRAIYP